MNVKIFRLLFLTIAVVGFMPLFLTGCPDDSTSNNNSNGNNSGFDIDAASGWQEGFLPLQQTYQRNI